ncbi:MAG: hypothetical protein WDZ94_01125 [Patescibacteria group bacterium]
MNAKSSQFDAQEKVISLFQRAYSTCPAYRDFIDEHDIVASQITKPQHIDRIPIMTKDNFLRKYPLNQRLIDNKLLSDCYMMTASSGSTGEPLFWPRDYDTDKFLEKKKERLYQDLFDIKNQKTLCINTFALGIWTAGVLTSKFSWGAAEKNPMTVISTGMNFQAIADTFRNIVEKYDQVIMLGYPPVLMEVIEHISEEFVNLAQFNIKILYTSDSLSPKAKERLLQLIGKADDHGSVVGFYACTDTGIVGAQTRVTATAFEELNQLSDTKMSKILQKYFSSSKIPALYQYDPMVKYLEAHDGEILVTADQNVPLIRYKLGDRGGIIAGSEIAACLKSCKKNSNQLKTLPSLSKQFEEQMYVFIMGRSDAVLFTTNIYIEDIKYCLESSSFSSRLTGHFRFGTVEESTTLKKQLRVQVFLKNKSKMSRNEEKIFVKEFVQSLYVVNSDVAGLQNVTIQDLIIEFLPDSADKYTNFKLKHFL